MAEQDTEVQTVETTTAATTETVERPQATTPDEIKAELARVQAALKDANNEAASRRKKLEAYEAAETKRKEAEMTDLQKAQAKLAEYEAKTKAYEFEKLQAAAAAKAGLPAAYADRLRGETPEELEADAKLLLEAMPKAAAKSTPAIPATNPGGATWRPDARAEGSTDARLVGGNRKPVRSGRGIYDNREIMEIRNGI